MSAALSIISAVIAGCYTSPREPMPFKCRPNLGTVLLLLMAITTVAVAQQEPPSRWTAPASALISRILEKSGHPSTVAFSVENHSSIPAVDADEIKRILESQLRAAGATRALPENATTEVKVTLSENAQGYLWVAAIREGTTTELVMMPVPRISVSTVLRKPVLVLRKTLVRSQAEPMLDFVQPRPEMLMVLEREHVLVLDRKGEAWDEAYALPLERERPWPRDLRGRFVTANQGYKVLLPGVNCQLNATTKPASMQCGQSDDPWPLSPGDSTLFGFYGPARNFFNGVLASRSGNNRNVPAFYSAATVNNAGQELWAFSGVDGMARIYGNGDAPIQVISEWGSELVGIRSGCGQGSQLLVTAPVDHDQPDLVQAVEVSGREATPVSPVLEMPGPVTALWQSSDESVRAVVKNLANGNYEAYILTVDCRQ